MTEDSIDKLPQHPTADSVGQSTQPNSIPDENILSVTKKEIEEWDRFKTDERKPQFRSTENYRRGYY